MTPRPPRTLVSRIVSRIVSRVAGGIVVVGIVVGGGAGSGCYVLGLRDDIPCNNDDSHCPDGLVCRDFVCVAPAGEGEGEGEGEGDSVFVDVVGYRGSANSDVLRADLALRHLAGFRASGGEPAPSNTLAAQTTTQTVALSGGVPPVAALEAIFRSPNSVADGNTPVRVLQAASGDNGLFVQATTTQVTVIAGQYLAELTAAPGTWHHLVCVAQDGLTDAGLVCALDGVGVVGELTFLDGSTVAAETTSLALLTDNADAAIAVAHVWGADLGTDVDAVLRPGPLAALQMQRTHAYVGVSGLVPVVVDPARLDEPPRLNFASIGDEIVAVQVAPTWPRVELETVTLEPARTGAAALSCDTTERQAGVDFCLVDGNGGLVLGSTPATPSTLLFIGGGTVGDVSFNVDADGTLVDCVPDDIGFFACALPANVPTSTLRATGPAFVLSPWVNGAGGGPTTAPAPLAGVTRPPDVEAIDWPESQPLLVISLLFDVNEGADFFEVFDADAPGGACAVDADCDSGDICSDGVCSTPRSLGRLRYEPDVGLRFDHGNNNIETVAIDDATDGAIVVLRRFDVFNLCEGVAGCANFTINPGARILFGSAKNARADQTQRFTFLRAQILE